MGEGPLQPQGRGMLRAAFPSPGPVICQQELPGSWERLGRGSRQTQTPRGPSLGMGLTIACSHLRRGALSHVTPGPQRPWTRWQAGPALPVVPWPLHVGSDGETLAQPSAPATETGHGRRSEVLSGRNCRQAGRG